MRLLVLVLALTACHKSEAPVAVVDAAASRALPPDTVAKRFDDEDAIDGGVVAVVKSEAALLTSVGKGTVLATLAPDTSVTELAERNGFFFVRTSDDKAGWVARFAFEEAPTKPAPVVHCPANAVGVRDGDAARCAYPCKSDRECRDGATCEAARVVDGTFTPVCTGGSAAKSSSVPSLFGAPHGPDGKCPTYFVSAPSMGKLCYRSCKVDRDCPQQSTCRVIPGTPGKPGNQDDAKLCWANL